MINHGRLLYDGNLHSLASKFAPYKLLRVTVNDESAEETCNPPFPAEASVVERENSTWTLNVRQAEVPMVAAHILNTLPVADIAIEDPAIETVIDAIYQGGKV